MKYALRMTEAQHAQLRFHLFPGDGNEAVALLLCGRRNSDSRHVFTARRVVTVPHNVCNRRSDRVTWPTDLLDSLLEEAYERRQAIVKVHSHTGEYRRFSGWDDESDRNLFSSIANLLGDGLPHGSLVMLPDGDLFGRVLGDEGKVIGALDSITAVGHDLRFWTSQPTARADGFTLRHSQAFGCGTTDLLRSLSAAVIGCSGTGSIVAEQLARLGVGRLVLVDPDRVEEKNLNRILNTGKEDAYLSRPKVHVMASAIARMGLGQEVVPLAANLISPSAVRLVAECDVAFGCMDGVEGRHVLNRLATFYNLPYFDVGVRLDADGNGGIERIAGAVHYLQPGLSSLLSRGVYTMAHVEAEEMRRTNPEMYQRQVKEGYLRGVQEDRPAVISINMFFASLAVNDFLARLHPYRNQPNSDYVYIGGSLSEMQFYPEAETAPCVVLQRHVGRGDTEPLLERPVLS
ncbi:MAG: thiamine biosynthesis protein ThiF [Planctomycetes bacterium UTPLA1]|nr:MAG: thiamine biosynthesis protein ThiF [Planctomycetes bacterium UTPLA1]